MILYDVPQISSKTGVSGDYINAFQKLIGYVAALKSGTTDNIEWELERFSRGGFKHYEDRYPSTEYRDVITERNGACVGRLNLIVDELNKLAPTKPRDINYLASLKDEILRLIYGD